MLQSKKLIALGIFVAAVPVAVYFSTRDTQKQQAAVEQQIETASTPIEAFSTHPFPTTKIRISDSDLDTDLMDWAIAINNISADWITSDLYLKDYRRCGETRLIITYVVPPTQCFIGAGQSLSFYAKSWAAIMDVLGKCMTGPLEEFPVPIEEPPTGT